MNAAPPVPAYLNIDRENHPAVLAGRRSRDCVTARDKQGWLDNFTDDARVEDPVGPSMFDPDGIGFTGRERISEFWDASIANTQSIEFVFDEEIICGPEVAYIGKIVTHIGGHVSEARGVFTYRAADDGRLSALRAFWEVEQTINSLRPE
ncbi:nuclear transport factor 2 family protein [Gordonia sinesedis]